MCIFACIVITSSKSKDQPASGSPIAPPTNRRLHEPEKKEYSPLQAAKLKKQMRDRILFIYNNIHMEKVGSATTKKNEGEKTRNRFRNNCRWHGGGAIVS